MATSAIPFKQGTTFALSCTYTQDTPSAPADLTGVIVECAVRDAGYNYYPCVVNITSPTTFTVIYPHNTLVWVTGPAYFDFRLRYGPGSVFYCETVAVEVLPSITGTQTPTNTFIN